LGARVAKTKRATVRKTRPKLTAEQRRANKLKADHIRAARAVFRNSGFERVVELAEKEISFGGQAGEFDDAFLYENVLLLIEYTTSQGSDVTDHLKKKKIIFSRVLAEPSAFLHYLKIKFPRFADRLGDDYHEDRYLLRVVYCSRNQYDGSVKAVVDEPAYLDYPVLKYFEKISSIIKLSAQPELLQFLGIEPSEVGQAGKFPKKGATDPFHGSILPDEASGYPKGYKVVSFYADAASLLERAFVLRRSGWRGSFEAYQRMLIPGKVEAIRTSLRAKRQVAVNNIIATLPSDVNPIKDGKTADITKLTRTAPVEIALPIRANSIGLVDGQHRLFSYYRSRDDDPLIAKLRDQQNLLVTGIIYPESTTPGEKERFEASLFLSINSHQTGAPPDLRQEIEVLLNPFSPTAIAKQVMQRLASSGPLAGHVESFFFEKGKLKTSSIVSYALGPLLKLNGSDSLFAVFSHVEKNEVATGASLAALEEYLKFATTRINIFLSAVRLNVARERWTTERSQKDRLLSVTYVNAFLITLRMLIGRGKQIDFDHLKGKLVGIDVFDFRSFHSSQYNRMAEKIVATHFS
jgi:DGQHR domain-containing protein